MTGEPPGDLPTLPEGPVDGGLVLAISPSDPALDTTIRIRTSGSAPGAFVSITASQLDASGRTWSSATTFVADGDGVVDTTSDEPFLGSYEGVDAMGLVWSMAREDIPPRGMPGPPLAPVTLLVTAGTAGGPPVTATIDRARLPGDVTRIPLTGPGVSGALFHPAGDGPWPGVLLLGGSDGDPRELDAALLAAHGFCVMAFGYLGASGAPAALVDVPLEMFGDAIELLLAQPEVRGDQVGVLGSSREGEAALLVGASFPTVGAVVSTVGSGLVTAGVPRGSDLLETLGSNVGSWTWRGRRLRYLRCTVGADLVQQVGSGEPVELARAFRTDLATSNDLAAATIAVERIRGPVLLLSAEDDRRWPSADLSDFALRRLQRARHPFPFEHVRYPGAGHGIGPPPFGPTELVAPGPGVLLALGGSVAGTSAARADAWLRTIEWFAEHLPA